MFGYSSKKEQVMNFADQVNVGSSLVYTRDIEPELTRVAYKIIPKMKCFTKGNEKGTYKRRFDPCDNPNTAIQECSGCYFRERSGPFQSRYCSIFNKAMNLRNTFQGY